jgi:hypothetical protein
MSRAMIARYVTPWKFRREAEQRRLGALRQRDGDDCRRCRRPLRFDLPPGHDWGPKVEQIAPSLSVDDEAIDNLCLCHRRCNAEAADNTVEVKERVRMKNEAELFSKSRSRTRVGNAG